MNDTQIARSEIEGLTFYEDVDHIPFDDREPKRTFVFSFYGNAEVEATVECDSARETEREWFELATKVVKKWSQFGNRTAFEMPGYDDIRVSIVRATGINHDWRSLHKISCKGSASYAEQDVPTFRVDRQVHGTIELVFFCPNCGKRNAHGTGKQVLSDDRGWRLPDTFGHRKSHCDCWPKGYNLEAGPADEIPF